MPKQKKNPEEGLIEEQPKRRGRPKKAQDKESVEKAAAEFMEAEKKAEPAEKPAEPKPAPAAPAADAAPAQASAAPQEERKQGDNAQNQNAQAQGQNQGQNQGQAQNNQNNQNGQNNRQNFQNNQNGNNQNGNNRFNNKFNKFNKFKNRHGRNLPQDDFIDESIQLPPPDPEKVAAARAKWKELRGQPMFELQRQADELGIPDFKTMRKQALVYSILSATTSEDCPIYT